MAKNKYVVAESAIRVEGLKELQTGLRNVSRSLTKETRSGFKKIADHVVGVAQQRMPFQTGEAARSLKPKGLDTGAAIAFPAGGLESWTGTSGQKGGYYPWLDFGGGVPWGRGVSSSSPIKHERSLSQRFRRKVIKGGRYLYPAIAESSEYIGEETENIIEHVFEREQFKVVG